MEASPRVRNWLAGLAILAASVVPYLSTFRAGFVFDDHVLVRDSAALRGPLADLWLGRGVFDWWPLTWTSLWIDFRLFGLDPSGYHVENVALHAATALLAWRVLARLRVPGAWLAAAIFAAHPVAVESVAWISERKNVLSGALFAASILAWVRFDDDGDRRAWTASLVLFLLALLAKTSVVMLPVVLLLLVLHRRGRWNRQDWLRTAPYFALSLALGLVTVWYQWTRAVGEQTGAPRGPLERIGASGWALARYVQTAFVPVKLGLVYPEWPVPPSSPLFWAPAALLLAAAAALTWLWLRRRSRFVLALAYHAAMVLPILGLVEIAWFYISPMANHLQYLALLGPASLGGAGLALGMRGRFRAPAVAAAVALVLLLGATAARRALSFESDATLWAAAVREQPGALYGAWMLSDILGDASRRPEALVVLTRLEGAAPDRPTRGRARALRAFHERRLDDAAREALESWGERPSYSFQESMGDLLLRAGRPDLALSVLGPLVVAAPQFEDARNTYGKALAAAKRRGTPAPHIESGARPTP